MVLGQMPGQSGGAGGGGFGALGGLVLVVSLMISMRKMPPGPVGKLMQSGAVSPETALKPTTAKIARPHELVPGVRSGIILELDDGRCWVDVAKLKRRRVRTAIVLAITLAVVAEGAWLALRSMRVL